MSRRKPDPIVMMRHALGYGVKGLRPGWRNNYCCGVGTDDEAVWQSLCESGHARRGAKHNDGADVYFYVEPPGVDAARKGSLDPDAPEPVSRVRAFVVTFRGKARIIEAASRGAARFEIVRTLRNFGYEVRELLPQIRVRLAHGLPAGDVSGWVQMDDGGAK